MWRGSCQNFPGKLRQGTHLQLVSHLEVSADPISPGHPSGLSIASSGCRCPLEDPPFPSPGLPSFTPEDQGWGLTAAWSRKCSAPAVGSAKLTGHPVGHGPHQSPTAPAITGDSGMEKIPHQHSCQIFPYLMGLLFSLALTPLPWPWDAHAPGTLGHPGGSYS